MVDVVTSALLNLATDLCVPAQPITPYLWQTTRHAGVSVYSTPQVHLKGLYRWDFGGHD